MLVRVRVVVAAAIATVLVVLSGGVALAVSGGGYDPGQEDCSPGAQSNRAPNGTTEPGCHWAKVNVEDGSNTRYAEVGLDQLPNGYPSTPGLFGVGYPGSPNFPHSGCVAVNTNGTGGGPGTGCGTNPGGLGATTVFDTDDMGRTSITPEMGTIMLGRLLVQMTAGTRLYLGADDNGDAGEHDGVSGLNGTNAMFNGPSDGGAIQVTTSPNSATTTPTLADPLPFFFATFGACADGICFDLTTRQQELYRGNPNGTSSRDVANYDGKAWDPYTCSSGSQADEKSCKDKTHGDMNSYRNGEAHSVNAEPGVQVFEDPDAQSSPIDPIYEGGGSSSPMLYPLIGAYVGTCGVILGGGPAFSALAPAGTLPNTNSAGQIVIPTGC